MPADTDTDESDGTTIDWAAQRATIADIETNRPDPTPYDPDATKSDLDTFAPRGKYKLVLAALADEHPKRVTPRLVRMRTGLEQQYCSEILWRLAKEGWVWRVKRPNLLEAGEPEQVRGLYEYNAPSGYDAFGELDQ